MLRKMSYFSAVFYISLALCLTFSFGNRLHAAEEIVIRMTLGDPWMSVNGLQQEIDPGRGTVPLIIDGRTLLPIRSLIEAMGGFVSFDDATSEIGITANDHHLQMWLDRTEFIVDNEQKTMDIAPQSVNGRTMVPLRFVAENIDCDVLWLAESSEIVISFGENTSTLADDMPSNISVITEDRQGNPITLPAKVERLVVLGPSNNEILTALGCSNLIVATDSYSANVEGIDPDTALLSITQPDGEHILSLEPDIVVITGMARVEGNDPLHLLSDLGICVIYIPSSSNITGIIEDIRFLGLIMSKEIQANDLITTLETEIAKVRAIGETIERKRTVYFEISAAPYMYSFGSGVFLNEMIELIGAVNVFVDHESWMSVADEAILSADPEIILTNVSYIDDPIAEIMSRPGWQAMQAVQNNAVYQIDDDASSRPSQHISEALWEMAKAIYPEYYGEPVSIHPQAD